MAHARESGKLQARATSDFIFPHTSYRTIDPSIFLRVGPLYKSVLGLLLYKISVIVPITPFIRPAQREYFLEFINNSQSDRVDLPSLDYRHYDHMICFESPENTWEHHMPEEAAHSHQQELWIGYQREYCSDPEMFATVVNQL
ncbi:unnamed protein product [Rhizophagus irregularis]|nr:unnamed protein product [Rhizophagus irregularis]